MMIKVKPFSEKALSALRREAGFAPKHEAAVRVIVEAVRKRGDRALLEFTRRFDGVSLKPKELVVREQEFRQAYKEVPRAALRLIREARRNIQAYHEREPLKSWKYKGKRGERLGQRLVPIDRVGIYAPGGKALYPSSVLMCAVPAKVARVRDIVLATPPRRDGQVAPILLVAAREIGIKTVYKMGGAQAIAALAYGTETVRRVDKIVGPGNLYVALAKKLVFGDVGIDMIAGPSEVVILCDGTASAKEVAADLLAQAEHDERASAIAITNSASLGKKISQEVEEQLATLPRKKIARASWTRFGGVFIVKDMKRGVEAANRLAPEHLEIMTRNPRVLLPLIRNAGAVFLGRYTPEPLGDYWAGPSHVLPTSGTARFSSVLSVADFLRRQSVIEYSGQALKACRKKVAAFARLEGLEAHARSAESRP
jgi:histidinol dehydrogenase